MVLVEFNEGDWEKVQRIIVQYEKNKVACRESARMKSNSNGRSGRGRKSSEEIKWTIVKKKDEITFDCSDSEKEEVEVVEEKKKGKSSV